MENEKVQVENTSANNEYKYTQQDMDNITEKVREKTYQNALKNMVDRKEYEQLLEKYNVLETEKRQGEIKQAFINKGGDERYFNDFYKLNSNMDIKDFDKVAANHPWAFKEQSNHPYFKNNNIKDNDENISLYDGYTTKEK